MGASTYLMLQNHSWRRWQHGKYGKHCNVPCKQPLPCALPLLNSPESEGEGALQHLLYLLHGPALGTLLCWLNLSASVDFMNGPALDRLRHSCIFRYELWR